jgi:hypothetical protein
VAPHGTTTPGGGGPSPCPSSPRTTPAALTTTPTPLALGIEEVNRLIGLNGKGEALEFAINVLNDAEFAGATFLLATMP